MKKQYTIAQVLATPEGQYVSAEVFAVLSRATPPRGKGPWTAQLTDSTGTIVGKFWGGDISYWEGKRIRLSGQGMQRKGYNGTPELSVGQKAEISFAGAPGTAGQEEDGIPGDPVAPASTQQSKWVYPAASAQPPVKTQGNAVHGATVGGALARAVEIWRHIRPGGSGAMPDQQDFEDIERLAAALVIIQQRIESGENSVSPARQARIARRSAPTPTAQEVADEDIPF